MDWGYNRDNEDLPQVNYALLCLRKTGMPLFAWPLTGSVSDVRTLENTLQFLDKLDFRPDCLMMDRGFASRENITYMFKKKHTFLQALKVNADWVRTTLDIGETDRMRPDSMIKDEGRSYYVSTTPVWWIVLKRTKGKNVGKEEVTVFPRDGRKALDVPDGFEIVSRFACSFHALFCYDLVGNQYDRFMDRLKNEYEKLVSDESSEVVKDLKDYFVIERKKYARQLLSSGGNQKHPMKFQAPSHLMWEAKQSKYSEDSQSPIYLLLKSSL